MEAGRHRGPETCCPIRPLARAVWGVGVGGRGTLSRGRRFLSALTDLPSGGLRAGQGRVGAG